MRVVDQAFPADCGAWLFKVDAHHDIQSVCVLCAQLQEPFGIVMGKGNVVNRAGANDHQQTVVAVLRFICAAALLAVIGGAYLVRVFGRPSVRDTGAPRRAVQPARPELLCSQAAGHPLTGHAGRWAALSYPTAQALPGSRANWPHQRQALTAPRQ